MDNGTVQALGDIWAALWPIVIVILSAFARVLSSGEPGEKGEESERAGSVDSLKRSSLTTSGAASPTLPEPDGGYTTWETDNYHGLPGLPGRVETGGEYRACLKGEYYLGQ